jgi:hypothetical protein
MADPHVATIVAAFSRPFEGSAVHRQGVRLGAAAIVLVAVAVGFFIMKQTPVAAKAARTAGPQPASARAVDDSMAADLVARFALNALIAPLLDDDVPPRWTDIGLKHYCGPATRVEVDGKPMVPGSRLPATAFTMRWHLDQCWPFDTATTELSGSVELLVFHEDTGLSAVVIPERLVIGGATTSNRLSQPFAAVLSLASADTR